MNLFKRGNSWLTSKQLLEYNEANKPIECVLSEDKVDDEQLTTSDINVAETIASDVTEPIADTIPTNFMQLKKYAKGKGVDISIYKTKEQILKQLNK